MGKDREGKFHPQKGKPSGSGREETVGLNPAHTERIDDYLEISEKYDVSEDGLMAIQAPERHPNRNVDKGETHQRQKNHPGNVNKPNGSRTEETELSEQLELIEPEEIVTLNKESLTDLAGFSSVHCISFFIPTPQSGVEGNEQQQHRIKVKNALQDLALKLKNRGVHQNEVARMLGPGYQLIENDQFWQQQKQEGIAFFIADDFFKFIRIPFPVNESVQISTAFSLAPLADLITSKEYFYLLVLSKKQAKLFRGDAFGMTPIILDDMPNGVDDVVHFEEKEDQKLWRTGSSGGGGGANYHGIGAGKPDEKEHIAMYFDEVDETIWKNVLHNENAPLLLSGVDYLIPIFKQVSQYKPIWDNPLNGSHEHHDMAMLYQQAMEKMKPYFNERNDKALHSFQNHSATELTSTDESVIIPAAYYGRVAKLFVQQSECIWGTFNESDNELQLHDQQQEGDECLLNKALIKTFLTGGDVFVLSKEQMPENKKMAALLRY